MPPKFQSSFIPKGPVGPSVSSVGVIPQARPVRRHDILSFLAKGIFALSILLAAGVVGYKWYLGYSIGKMSAELDVARQEVASGVTGELIRLNDRIVSTETLIENHRVLSPIFAFLQTSTPKSVRFSEFNFVEDMNNEPKVVLKGAAKSYASLALEASVIYKNQDFKNPVFSDIRLDEKGNVTFSLEAGISPELISYTKTVGRVATPATAPVVPVVPVVVATTTKPAATSTATTTPKKTN